MYHKCAILIFSACLTLGLLLGAARSDNVYSLDFKSTVNASAEVVPDTLAYAITWGLTNAFGGAPTGDVIDFLEAAITNRADMWIGYFTNALAVESFTGAYKTLGFATNMSGITGMRGLIKTATNENKFGLFTIWSREENYDYWELSVSKQYLLGSLGSNSFSGIIKFGLPAEPTYLRSTYQTVREWMVVMVYTTGLLTSLKVAGIVGGDS